MKHILEGSELSCTDWAAKYFSVDPFMPICFHNFLKLCVCNDNDSVLTI